LLQMAFPGLEGQQVCREIRVLMDLKEFQVR
jgi:hypothetical protein